MRGQNAISVAAQLPRSETRIIASDYVRLRREINERVLAWEIRERNAEIASFCQRCVAIGIATGRPEAINPSERAAARGDAPSRRRLSADEGSSEQAVTSSRGVMHVILTISASSATSVRSTFFPRHPARSGPRVAASKLAAGALYSTREKEREREREREKGSAKWTTTTSARTSDARTRHSGCLPAFWKRMDGDVDDGGRRERRESPAESEGDSPRTLLRAELFPASIRFRRRNMRGGHTTHYPRRGASRRRQWRRQRRRRPAKNQRRPPPCTMMPHG